MKPKLTFYILGVVTIVLFPIIGFLLFWFFKDYSIPQFLTLLEFQNFTNSMTYIGLEFGLLYGFIVIILSNLNVFQKLAQSQKEVFKNMKLTLFDAFFIAICAGVGEEILFRVVIQSWLGPWITTFLFIIIHGYFSPFNLKKNILGITLFPFILLISYGYEIFGLWFAIAAHFAYDFILFLGVIYEWDEITSSTSD